MTRTTWPPHRNKYGVAPKAARTYNGVVYHSKAEAKRAQELDLLLKGGAIREWRRQVTIKLGPDIKYRADFIVVDDAGVIHAEDVKGYETPDFKRVRRLWQKYMDYPLVVLKRKGKGWARDVVEGGTAARMWWRITATTEAVCCLERFCD